MKLNRLFTKRLAYPTVVQRFAVWITVLALSLSVGAHIRDNKHETSGLSDGVGSLELRELQSRASAAIDKVQPAIVAVGNRFGRAPDSINWEGKRFASGVIIREDGLILSQYHVSHAGAFNDVTGLNEYGMPGDKVDVILHDGRRMEAELLGGERLADISLLRLTEPGKYPVATFDEDSTSTLGDWVIKLGHPVGFQPARGAVSRIGRVVYVNANCDGYCKCNCSPRSDLC